MTQLEIGVDIPPYTSSPYIKFWLEKALVAPA